MLVDRLIIITVAHKGALEHRTLIDEPVCSAKCLPPATDPASSSSHGGSRGISVTIQCEIPQNAIRKGSASP